LLVRHDRFPAVEWAEKACGKMIESFPADALRAEYCIKDERGRTWLAPGPGPCKHLDFFGSRWRYNHGLFMVALQGLYEATGAEAYIEYTKQWADGRIDENGNICVNVEFLDSIQPGLALFMLYEKYGDKRYKTAIESLKASMKGLARTGEGVYSHNNERPHQIWLDGFYMAGAFTMAYGEKFGGGNSFFEEIAKHARVMTRHTRDEKTGLLCHAWDESKTAEWADKETGKSSQFWGRAVGWYVFTLADVLEKCPQDIPEYDEMKKMLTDQLLAVINFQDEKTGLWYQLLDKGQDPENWLETSCSCLFMYSIAKAVRLGLLDEKYIENVKRCYRGLFTRIDYGDEGFILYDISQGTMVSSEPDYYYKREKVCNDYHGIGIFVLACLEYSKI
jgi:unsaturated rhamnogalacturonyl hydrolase